jgi:hypothetical protein
MFGPPYLSLRGSIQFAVGQGRDAFEPNKIQLSDRQGRENINVSGLVYLSEAAWNPYEAR